MDPSGGYRIDAGTLGTFALALLVLSAALVIFVTLYVRGAAQRRVLTEQLRETREAQRRLAEALDVWHWRTDAAHRIVAWNAPSGSAPSNWSAVDTTLPLWEALRFDDPAGLRADLERGAALNDVAVHPRDPDERGNARLRGRARSDAHGAFAGYEGTLRALEVAAAPPFARTPATQSAADTAPAPADKRPTNANAPPNATSESDAFSFTVSHDLRAPIRVVEGFTKIVKEDYGRLLDRVGNDHLDRVLGAAARMNNMIDALLSLSKLASQPLVRQSVNLSQLANYVADDLRRQSPGRTVDVEIESGMQVEGDPTLLRVVVENLLGNAWKYTGKSEHAQISFARDDSADAFVVRDNGAGFDMRFADRLFGVFQRLHSANDFPGTGIGLASVRRIVRRHGGDIWGEAEPNRGARFHFTLPQ